MINELERLLSYSHSAYDGKSFSSVVVMKDGTTFSGVSIKNQIFRDAIYAEQLAIAKAVSAGYKIGDFDRIYVMVGTKNIYDLKYLNRDIIVEFLEPDREVFLIDLNRNQKVLKVGHLLFNIY